MDLKIIVHKIGVSLLKKDQTEMELDLQMLRLKNSEQSPVREFIDHPFPQQEPPD